MSQPFGIRVEQTADAPLVAEVVTRAFRSPVEAELVRLLRASDGYIAELSLVAEADGRVVGHVMLTYVLLADASRSHRVLSLSPLSVDPDHQRRGIGSALVREAVRRADERREPLVILEGSPVYYGRLGFTDARADGITFTLPDWAPPEAGQVTKLSAYDPSIRGTVVYPPAFAQAEALREAGAPS